MRIIWERNDAEPTYRTADVDEIYMDDSGQCYIICPITKLEHNCDEYGRWTDLSKNEYKEILMDEVNEALEPELLTSANIHDRQFVSIVQEQVDIALCATLVEMPNALPGSKLKAMMEKLLIIYQLEDMCMALKSMLHLQDASSPVSKNSLRISAIEELKKNCHGVYHEIFRDNTYYELMDKIQPFTKNREVCKDYAYLNRPEVREEFIELLDLVKYSASTEEE